MWFSLAIVLVPFCLASLPFMLVEALFEDCYKGRLWFAFMQRTGWKAVQEARQLCTLYLSTEGLGIKHKDERVFQIRVCCTFSLAIIFSGFEDNLVAVLIKYSLSRNKPFLLTSKALPCLLITLLLKCITLSVNQFDFLFFPLQLLYFWYIAFQNEV